MNKKRIVLCTSSGSIEYAPERYKNLGIEFLRICVLYGDPEKEYLEGLDLDPWHFFEYERTVKDPKNHLPHTSIPSRQLITDKFDELVERGFEEAFIITLSTGLGIMHDFVEGIAKEYEDKIKIHVIDTKTTCFCEGMIAVKAQELVDKGVDTETILKELDWQIKHTYFLGVCGSLDYLIYNGRLRGGKAFMGKLLKVSPALHFSEDGHIESFASAIGIAKSSAIIVSKAKEIIGDRDEKDYYLFHIYTGEGSDKPLTVAEEAADLKMNHEAVIASPVTGCHTGPEMAGFGLVLKRRDDEPLE